MVASMCEEVQNPEREVPRAMVLSVASAGITGLLFIIPLLYVLPDIQMLLAVSSGQPIALVFKEVTDSAAGGFGLLFLILGIWLFAGIGSLTVASRCTFAFARDGAIPGWRLWSKINTKLDVPLWGIILSTAIDCILGCIYLGSAAAFNSFTGVATICLSTSYGVPILVSMARGRKAVKHSPYSLGRAGYMVNGVAVLWIVFSIALFCMPTAVPVTASSMNYASVVFASFASISFIWYIIYARKNFTGPPVPIVENGAGEMEVMGMSKLGQVMTEEDGSNALNTENSAPKNKDRLRRE